LRRGPSAQGLDDLYKIRDGVSGTHVEYHQVKIPRGKEVVLADLTGPGKVTYWYFTDDTNGKLCPGLVLRVFWDDEPVPSIDVPLADFFGAMGGHTIDYQSAPLKIEHLCSMCYLPMPFARRARFVLANDGDRDYSQSVAYGIDHETGEQYAREKSRLHCAWRRSNPVKDGLHAILDVKGRGHYLGNILQVHTRFARWCGEGDTIFQLDGKTITHAPGTEDEYGSCWGFGDTYAYLESGYLQNDRGNNLSKCSSVSVTSNPTWIELGRRGHGARSHDGNGEKATMHVPPPVVVLVAYSLGYLVFLIWYGGRGRPMTAVEADSLLERVRLNSEVCLPFSAC